MTEERARIVGDVRRHWMSSGLLCATVVGPVLQINGYVCVPEGHPWHRVDYSEPLCPTDCPDSMRGEDYCTWEHSLEGKVEVHGGVTFSGDDLSDGLLPSEGGWWFGFDTCHSGDFAPGLPYNSPDDVLRDDAYVEMHTDLMALQLAAVTERFPTAPLLTHSEV